MQVLGRSWADAGQLQTFLHHSEAWSRPREARPKTTDWEPVSGQRLGRSLEVPGLGRAGQMLRVSGWRFWEDLVRCWPNVFNLGALPVPCQDRFFLELEPSVFEVFPSKTVLSLEFQPLLTLRFAKVTCAKP